MPAKKITVRRGPWRFVWSGGRLADVYHAAKPGALDCVQVGEYDWQAGEPKGTRADLIAAADEWMAEEADTYTRELPYL